MTSRQDWPKPDLLQQRRLELGLPEPIAAEPFLNQGRIGDNARRAMGAKA